MAGVASRGSDDIRRTMAAHIGLQPHLDVVRHHTTVAGDFAMTRSQWRITGTGAAGRAVETPPHTG
jgi:ketosteroid isomerase-like protein